MENTSIETLINMVNWYSHQCEYMNDQIKSIKIAYQIYSYCIDNGIEYIDDDYFNSKKNLNFIKHYKHIHKLLKNK